MAPAEIARQTGPAYSTQALFGYVSGLADAAFMEYVFEYRHDLVVRRVFFSEIEKRTEIACELVDELAAKLLAMISAGSDRTKNEAMLRRLGAKMSTQMRTRMVRTLLSKGTKLGRRNVLRWITPTEAPGTESAVLELALKKRDEDALVGIIYRWPVEHWREYRLALFEAASSIPWLQRQVIFRTGNPDEFLERRLIADPITELYVRARYGRPASRDLVVAATALAKKGNPANYNDSQRSGLVAWCLGRLGHLDCVAEIEAGNHGGLAEHSRQARQH